MKSWLKSRWFPCALAGAALLALGVAGCTSSSDDDDDASAAALEILTVSGTHMDIAGTRWGTCYSGTPDTFEVHEGSADGKTLTVTNYDLTSSGGGCVQDGATETDSFDLDAVGAADGTLTAWSDGSTTVAAPAALDSTTVIADPPGATAVDVTLGAESGQIPMLIDDTGTPERLFRDTDEPADPCGPIGVMAECLFINDFMEKL